MNSLTNLKLYRINLIFHLILILFTTITVGLLYYDGIFEIKKIEAFLDNEEDMDKTLVSDIIFSNVTNITNNTKDSVYAQIVADKANVYVVWQESVLENVSGKNYDIYFIKSNDLGNTFRKPINLSNNTGFSEHPQIALSKNGIFVVWTDNTDSNNTEIMFTKSVDNGNTFSKPINISNNSKNSNNVEISAFNENVYVVWQDIDQNNILGSVMFKSSLDGGNTFTANLELVNDSKDSYPKVNSYEDYVYVVWNKENNIPSTDSKKSGLFFIKSSDRGISFEDKIRIVHNNFGESQIAVAKDEVVIAWGGLLTKNINDIYFISSDDNGTSFTNPYTIEEKVINAELKNYSKVINHPSNVELPSNDSRYMVWQDITSKENHDIFFTGIKKSGESNKIINLSTNSGVSECPQIAISNNYIYVIWEDITPGNHEILFTRGELVNY